MHGLTTINKLNSEAAEAAEIMKSKGFDAPDFEAAGRESVANGRVETHEHIPLGQTPSERIGGGTSN
jgi:hypothetical protein